MTAGFPMIHPHLALAGPFILPIYGGYRDELFY